jgi:signal transduction histidine kinase
MYRRHWIRIVGPLLLFAAVGTVGMALLLNAAFQRLSHSEFVALAEANADFIRDNVEVGDKEPVQGLAAKANPDFLRDAHSVQAKFLTGHLSQLRGVEVHFQRLGAPDARHEAVTVPINSGAELTLIRERPRLHDVLLQPISLGALTAFWALWFALAWAVTLPSLDAQRLGLLGSIATSLAHEIRNPIAAIRLHGQLLERTETVSAGLIVHEAAKIEDMLNQWMFLARPEPPRKTEIALVELIVQTVRVLEPAADHAKVHFAVTASPYRRVQADTHRLGQVFHNIILNAIQAMPKGGTLTITVSEKDISFADTGSGFSPMALRRGAEMLYSEKEGGMGLGLSVARDIVRAHGGRLTLGNRPEGGAIVRIEI